MITARQQKCLSTALSYFKNHLIRGDYYSEGREVDGVWFGEGASLLDLQPGSKVCEVAYERLCNNLHPITSEPLTVRKRVVDRRIYCDFTASTLKSVSIMSEMMGDHRIRVVHHMACRAASLEIEKLAATRVRRNGSTASRSTGNLVAALYTHTSSRALDPQLHSHFIVWNVTHDPVEKRWKAMETRHIFEQMTYLTEVYRNELAMGLLALGYKLRPTRHGFEIEGVSEAIIQRFSKGSAAIKAAVQTLEESLGQPVTNNEVASVAHQVRARKLRHMSDAEINRWQRSQTSEAEFADLQTVLNLALKASVVEVRKVEKVIPALERPTPSEPQNDFANDAVASPKAHLFEAQRDVKDGAVEVKKPEKAIPALNRPDPSKPQNGFAKEAIDFARDHLFERRSVVKDRQFLRVALRHSLGRSTLAELVQELDSRTEFLRHKGRLTTRAALDTEKQMMQIVDSGIGRFRPLNPGFEPSSIEGAAANALKCLLSSRDQVLAIDGLAGTGKTTLLKEFAKAVPNLSVFAPTGPALEVLKNSGFQTADTVQGLLIRGGHGMNSPVLVVDEAGMLSNQQMVELLKIIKEKQARMLLLGDHRQHSSVEAGDGLRILRKESQLFFVRLRRIRRQLNPEYRKAVKDIALGRISEGLTRLDRLNAIEVVPPEFRVARLCEDYVSARQDKEDILITSPTWKEIDEITNALRPQLKAKGLLPLEDTGRKAHRNLKWTLAEKRCLTNYAPGLVLTFHTPTRDMGRHQWGIVTKAEATGLDVRRQDGQMVRVTTKQAKAFEVQKEVDLPIAIGERLLLTETRKGQRLNNGKVVTVKAISPDGSMLTTEGITIPSDYHALAHGYAVTSHRSQARTVDRVFVSVPPNSTIATNRRQMYVSISRGRKGLKIYTSSRADVVEALGRKQVRPSALSFQRAMFKPNNGVKFTP